ncbi:hypothetical protein NEISUBOT_04282 [Neisseria subflava NJ9703]|uniref:Uncharacterized protein n=1 Tax=Neisseria subflava NJ9703 TaxID=546268 RepID=A0A9W5IRA0_NEISU|nr:hypothetical protein NEISUBOT_04282 [Neisseria subflava NJ9703]
MNKGRLNVSDGLYICNTIKISPEEHLSSGLNFVFYAVLKYECLENEM